MNLLGRFLCLLPLGGCLLAADPAPARIVANGGQAFDNAYVVDEAIDGISFVMDGKDPNAPKSKLAPGAYTLQYRPSQSHDYLTGEAAEREGAKSVDTGIQAYTAALASCRFDWERQGAYLGIARLAEVGKKYDAGVDALTGFQREYPRSIHLPQALYQLGHLQALKGDHAAAVKTFQTLKGHEKDWGVTSAVMGSLGIAETLVADNKAADAIAELSPWLSGKLAPEKNPEEFAKVGLALAQAQVRNNDPGAADTYHRLAYAPCGAAGQAAAQLGWATTLAAQSDPASILAAFDHAAIAATLPGGGPGVRTEAAKLAGTLVPRIAATGSDDNAKNKLTIEYRAYHAKLK